MRRRPHRLQVSTFPFLAVLLCAMGSLILLLLVLDRRARAVALARAREAAAAQTLAADSPQSSADEEWRRRRQELHARLLQELGEVANQIDDLRQRTDDAARNQQVVHARYLEANRQIEAEDLALRQAEADYQQQKSDLERRMQQADSSRKELARLAAQLAELERTLAQLQALRLRQQQTYSLVPYRGKHGDSRRPIYIECTSHGLVFHPDRQILDGLLMNPLTIRAEIDRRLRELRRAGVPADAPYLLFLIRPDGITSYYRTLTALDGLPLDFGYEFVDAGWVLDFSEDPNAVPLPAQAAGSPRPAGADTFSGAGSSPSAGSSHSPGVLYPGTGPGSGPGPVPPTSLTGDPLDLGGIGAPALPSGPFAGRVGTGSNGPGGQGVAPGSNPAGRGGTGLAPGLGPPLVPGSTGFSPDAGLGASGGPAGTGAAPRVGVPLSPPGAGTGVLPGLSPDGRGGAAASSASAGGSGIGSGEPDGTNHRPTFGSGAPGEPAGGGAASGIPGVTPGGSAGGGSVGTSAVDSSAERDTASLSVAAGQPAIDPPRAPGAPAGAPSAPDQAAPPQLTLQLPQKKPESPPPVPSTSRRSGSGGGDELSPPWAELGPNLPAEEKKPAPPPPRIVRLPYVDRDWTIVLECSDDRVILPATGQRFDLGVLSRPAAKNPLVLEVKRLIDRRQALVRAGEPPYRPRLRFIVQPDGLRAYYRAYPVLESLKLPMERETVQPEEPPGRRRIAF